MQFIIILLIISISLIIYKNRLIIRIDTFFRKGFSKTDDKYGVFNFCGKQGCGKTISAIDYILEVCKKQHKKVITNVKSFAESHKDLCIYEKDFFNIINSFNNGIYSNDYIIFYDELFTLLEKGKLNKTILSFISQLRKRKIYLITTAQEWLEINVTFRRYCRYYIDCNMINLPIFNCAFSINVIHDGYNMKWSNQDNDYVSPIISTTIKKCSLNIANSYDTFEVIETDYADSIHNYVKKNYKNF